MISMKKTLISALLLALSAHATARPAPPAPSAPTPKSDTINLDTLDLAMIRDDLALLQSLHETCGELLNHAQMQDFNLAYDAELKRRTNFKRLKDINAHALLDALQTDSEYQATLANMRIWTKSYPKAENHALCVEFSQDTP